MFDPWSPGVYYIFHSTASSDTVDNDFHTDVMLMKSDGIVERVRFIQSNFVALTGSNDTAELGCISSKTRHSHAASSGRDNRMIDCDFELEKYNIRRWREEAGFAARAEKDIGETEELKRETLKELRTLLEEQDEFIPRLEDDYLVRFLRAKKFDVDKAFRLLRQYYRCRLICPEKFCPIGLGPRDIKHLYDLRMGMLLPYRNPYDGTAIIVMQFGDWTPESGYDLMDTYTPVALAFDYVLKNPECQLNGFRIIFNFKGLELRYLKFLQPDVVRALMTCCQDGYPARFKGAHIVNNSYIYNIIWAFGKPFLNQKVRDRVQLHASDMSSLHEWISPEILPEDLGGKAGKLTHHWLMDEMYEHHDEFVKNSYYGYTQDKNGNSLDFTKERESETQVIS